ncbi:MAG: DNA repair protein RecN [Actinomycetota bacterium]
MARTPVIIGLGIRGLGVIDDAQIELGPGLTAITGETGAGKTMVLTGLSLLLGERTDAGTIGPGHDTALAEGRFVIAQDDRDSIEAMLDESGGQWDDDGTLLVTRTVSREGRSRSHLGGRSVPAATLADVGRFLVAVHGQDDQHRLLKAAHQQRALDRFGGDELAGVLADYRESHARLVDIEARLRDVVDNSRERAREAADLRETLALIDSVAPQPGEEEALRVESERLVHMDDLVPAVGLARGALSETADVGATGLVAQAVAALARVAQRDPQLAELHDRLARTATELDDLGLDVSAYLTDLDADPTRAAYVEERRAALAGLRRRLEFAVATDLTTWRDEAEGRLAELCDDDSLRETLRASRDEWAARAGALAAAVSIHRRSAAQRLAECVTAELEALAMPTARLEVEIRSRTRGDARVTIDGVEHVADRHGIDDVEFLLVPREGVPPRPLSKGASGGERSRIMLALEVVFAATDPVPTFVFDEVDAGVGGKAAVEVGRRLARLGRTSQVLVVTHLPQVAAFADRHLVVRPGEAVTSSSLSEVEGQARDRELARMLAGLEDSATALAHAQELRALATAEAGEPALEFSPAGRAATRRSRR